MKPGEGEAGGVAVEVRRQEKQGIPPDQVCPVCRRIIAPYERDVHIMAVVQLVKVEMTGEGQQGAEEGAKERWRAEVQQVLTYLHNDCVQTWRARYQDKLIQQLQQLLQLPMNGHPGTTRGGETTPDGRGASKGFVNTTGRRGALRR